MRKYRHFFFAILFLLRIGFVVGQNAPVTEPQLMYTQSNQFGISINSFKSWGAFYRYGWHKTGREQNHLEIDFSRIKHPKEVRRLGYTNSQSRYSFGRMNVLFFLRAGLGQTVAITERPYKNSIGLNFVYTLGANLAFLKPVYIEVFHPYENVSSEGYLVSERYDPEVHTDINTIYGNSAFTKGLGETALRLGGAARAGFQVEFAQYPDEIKSLEAGVTIDAFFEGIPLMAHSDYDQRFYGFYVAYSWGNRK